MERAASTGYVASAAGPREGLKRSDSQTTFADDVRPPTPPSLEEHDFDRERLKATRDRTDAVWAACAASAGSMWDDACIRARAALETERYRVDHHRGPRDTYGIIRSFSAVHDRLLSALAAASRRAFEELPEDGIVPLALLKGEGGGHGATGPRRRGLGVQELVGEARGAMLAAGASFAAKAESCVLCAPRSVDADELARLLAPPKELEALQARLLLRATPTSHGGAAAGET